MSDGGDNGRQPPEIPPTYRAGTLTGGWSLITISVWAGVGVGLAAVWAASRQIGLSTWWLGPPSGGQPLAVHLIPFAFPTVVIASALLRFRWVWLIGVVASLGIAAIALGDLGRVARLGLIEVALSSAGLAVSLASWSGTLRTGVTTYNER